MPSLVAQRAGSRSPLLAHVEAVTAVEAALKSATRSECSLRFADTCQIQSLDIFAVTCCHCSRSMRKVNQVQVIALWLFSAGACLAVDPRWQHLSSRNGALPKPGP